ncbi:MAG: hypothetical protein IID37_13255 [Planctomycetes bacterium]|nr:hypothetical protein [Planctomycetota bacterium]
MSVQRPDGYRSFIIGAVQRFEETITIEYDGRMFGGIMPELLAPEIDRAIKPGVEILVRHHATKTGDAKQLAHMLIRHPAKPEWVEVYVDEGGGCGHGG